MINETAVKLFPWLQQDSITYQPTKPAEQVQDDAIPGSKIPWSDVRVLARSTDPISSKISAAVATKSSRVKSDRGRILRYLQEVAIFSKPLADGNRLTCYEIAEATGVTPQDTQKRLPELRRAGRLRNGPIRNCRVTGRPCLTWTVL